MLKELHIHSTELANDGEHVQLNSVTYEGSEPFSGIFAVADLDSCIDTEPNTGKRMVNVIWALRPNAESNSECLSFELSDPPHCVTGIVGGGVDVIVAVEFR